MRNTSPVLSTQQSPNGDQDKEKDKTAQKRAAKERIVEKRSAFSSAIAEGNAYMKREEFQRAKDAFTKALNLFPNEKNVLVDRSKCYIQLGLSDKALADAETALQVEKNFYKGLLMKAEAFFLAGKFEYALIYYHRGNKTRKDIQEFRLGIHKSEIAIRESLEFNENDLKHDDKTWERSPSFSSITPRSKSHQNVTTPNSIPSLNFGSTSPISPGSKFTPRPLTYRSPSQVVQDASYSNKSREMRTSTTPRNISGMLTHRRIDSTLPSSLFNNEENGEDQQNSVKKQYKFEKRLLGELYKDKKYLNDLMNDQVMQEEVSTHRSNHIPDLVSSGIRYLDLRKQFWKHHQSISSSETSNDRPSSRASTARSHSSSRLSFSAFQRQKPSRIQQTPHKIKQSSSQLPNDIDNEIMRFKENGSRKRSISASPKLRKGKQVSVSIKQEFELDNNPLETTESIFQHTDNSHFIH